MLTLAHDSTVPHARRGWATLTSFAVQATVIGVALFIPLLHPDLLARLDLTPHPVPVFVPQAQAASPQQVSSGRVEAARTPWVLVPPRSIPNRIDPSADPAGSEPQPACLFCAAEGGQTVTPGGIGVIPLGNAPTIPKLAKPVRISVMMDGYLLRRVQPDYPAPARQSRIQGKVVLAAVIGKEGAIEHLQVLSGHPMLIPAALEAVRQWRYRPYILNGDPIEVDTQITVIFTLGT